MSNRVKFAHGNPKNIEAAKAEGIINERDFLCLVDDDGVASVGWIDKNGNTVLVQDKQADLSDLEADVSDLEIAVASKADAEKVEAELELKADVSEVESLEERVNAEFKKNATQKYEIAKAPEGTLVDYSDKEIRIMIPKTTDFANLNNGIAGVENMRYIECRIYAPEGAVRHKFDLDGLIQEGTVEAFSDCTDEYGRVYIASALPIASYNATTDAWVYYGVNSTTEHYVGWNRIIEWFDENDAVIASDSIRINLSNEDCHYAVEPYYVGSMMAEFDAKIEEKLADVCTIEVVEF